MHVIDVPDRQLQPLQAADDMSLGQLQTKVVRKEKTSQRKSITFTKVIEHT